MPALDLELRERFARLSADLESHAIEGFAREGHTAFRCELFSYLDHNLVQGGCDNAVGLAGTFKHIVSLYPWGHMDPGEGVESYLTVALEDGPVVPNHQQLYALAHWVNVCRQLGPTLVHCQAGLNRSALVTGLALVLAGAEPSVAIARMRAARSPAVLCNKKFEAWLLQQPVPNLGPRRVVLI